MDVLVTDPIADTGLSQLREAGYEVETAYDLDDDQLLDAVSEVHALIVRSGTDVTREVIEAAPELVIIARAGIGTDNIDETAATEHGVIVANAPRGNVRAAAEHTIAMTFATARSIPQAHKRLQEGEWAKDEFLGTEVDGKTLGIVGFGRVGREVGRRLEAHGMELVTYDPYVSAATVEQVGAELVDELETCLAMADIATVHTPLTPDTENMIGETELAELEDGYLINCARGGVVDEQALAEAVANGVLAGAAVDVFSDEPVSPDNPLLSVDDIVVTPHLGASTAEAQENVALSTADQVIAALAGGPVSNALNAPSIDETAYPKIEPYLDIAETAGEMAVKLFDGRVDEVEVTYSGDIASENVEPLTARTLKGVFTPLSMRVNAVNAQQIADDRGVDVTESKSRQSADFQSLMTVTLRDPDHNLSISGTLFADDDPRIVWINGYRVDAVPWGHMLITRNRDEPGVIGFIGSTLGENDINIAGMYNCREVIGGEALTVYDLDDPVPEEVQAELIADDRVTAVDYISLKERKESTTTP